jgi:hypothetical protein
MWKGLAEVIANDFSIAGLTMVAGASLYALGAVWQPRSQS